MEAHLYRNSKSLENHVKNQKIPQREEETPEKKQNAESPPPSSSTTSSPAREFSFAVSLHPLSCSSSASTKPNPNDRTGKTQHSFSALDLSPADDIFFHGHLLPLHLLSRIPVSPRTSTNSLDGFTLPVKDILRHQTTNEIITEDKRRETNVEENKASENGENIGKIKQKSFSLFGLSKWRKGFENRGGGGGGGGGEEETEEKDKNKKKIISLQFSHAVKKYMRMLFHRKENGTQFRRQTQSFSSASIISSRKNESSNRNYRRNLRGRRGEFSAPASMRTSPTNSGHLMVSPGVSSSQMSSSCSSSAADSTMEELQAAIQAAIAHCKNSIAVEDKIKS